MALASHLLASPLACARALAVSRLACHSRQFSVQSCATLPRAATSALATAAVLATSSRAVAAACVRPSSPATRTSSRFSAAPRLPPPFTPGACEVEERRASERASAATAPGRSATVRGSRVVATMATTPSSGAEASGGAEEAPLASRRCVPCEGKGLLPLTTDRVAALLVEVPGWEAVEEGGCPRLRRKWRTKNFLAGLQLFERVAQLAEAEGHHPDLHLEGWNNARIDIYTHAIGGLHENDFVLAAKISALPIEDLLRKPKTKIAG